MGLYRSQAYDYGWTAMCGLLPCRNVNHVLVDSWANGWVFDEVRRTKITLLFVPQILQKLGFLLILGGFIYELFVEYVLYRKNIIKRLFKRAEPKVIDEPLSGEEYEEYEVEGGESPLNTA